MEQTDVAQSQDLYSKLITLLDDHKARYRLIEHAPEGRTDLVSAMRGHDPAEAAKCIVIMVKIGKKVTKYVLAVVPGDKRVNLNAIKELFEGTYVAFASQDIAERLAGSVSGTVLPFSFTPELELIVDRAVLQIPELYFNAARLDVSLALNTSDYQAIAKPRLEQIAQD